MKGFSGWFMNCCSCHCHWIVLIKEDKLVYPDIDVNCPIAHKATHLTPVFVAWCPRVVEVPLLVEQEHSPKSRRVHWWLCERSRETLRSPELQHKYSESTGSRALRRGPSPTNQGFVVCATSTMFNQFTVTFKKSCSAVSRSESLQLWVFRFSE